jgi:NAD(P)-dependent dehydrogenase (short-subunit alcohol dehydrogenase family)
MARSIPLRRLATPEDLASLVVWLGSGANSYVSGETISLSGGDQR